MGGISRAQKPAAEYDRQQERSQAKEKLKQQGGIIVIVG
jgi:hypothetical protein